MEVHVNMWAVLLAAASSMIVGAVWYARPVLGRVWMRAAGIDEKKQGKMAGPMVMIIIASLLTAFVLAHVSYLSNQFFRDSFFQDAVSTAFWLWLGLSATTLVTHYSFEQKPAKLVWLNVANRFVTIMVMGLIIGWLHP
jgi:hypothetical protein